MKNKLLLLFLILSFTAFAQVVEEEVEANEEPQPITVSTFEPEEFIQKQEEISREPTLFAEETSVDEEVYDADLDYND